MSESTSTIRFHTHGDAQRTSLQMAPLIDIVFLLICFYLLVTQLISDQSDPAVTPPAMNSQRSAEQTPGEIVVNLRADGALRVGGRTLGADAVRSLLADGVIGAAGADETLRVVIRADRRQNYRQLDELIQMCRELEIPNVILRVREERP